MCSLQSARLPPLPSTHSCLALQWKKLFNTCETLSSGQGRTCSLAESSTQHPHGKRSQIPYSSLFCFLLSKVSPGPRKEAVEQEYGLPAPADCRAQTVPSLMASHPPRVGLTLKATSSDDCHTHISVLFAYDRETEPLADDVRLIKHIINQGQNRGLNLSFLTRSPAFVLLFHELHPLLPLTPSHPPHEKSLQPLINWRGWANSDVCK